MLALATVPSSAIHHSAASSRSSNPPSSTSIRSSRTTSPPVSSSRKAASVVHKTPSHPLTHSASTPSSSSVLATGTSSRPSAPVPPSPPTRLQQQSQGIDINALPQSDLLRLLSQLLQRIASVNDKIYHAAAHSTSSRSEHQQHHPPVPPLPLHHDPSPRSYLATPPPEPDPTPLFSSLTTASRASVGSPTCSLFFHARNVPTISIESYLLRILKYCPTTNEVFLSLLVYFDRMGVLAERVTKELSTARKPVFEVDPEEAVENGDKGVMPLVIDSYNVHRLIIAGVTVASKFFSDVFYTNSRYAKVGGLPTHELNKLELQFLLLNDFRLVISVEELQRYAEQLIAHSSGTVSSAASAPASTSEPAPDYSSPSMELFHKQCDIPHVPKPPPLPPLSGANGYHHEISSTSPTSPVPPPSASSSSTSFQSYHPTHSHRPSFSSSITDSSVSGSSSVAPTPPCDHVTPSSSTSTITPGDYGNQQQQAESASGNGHPVYGGGPLMREPVSVASSDTESNSEAGETSVEEELEEDEEPTIRFTKHPLAMNGDDHEDADGDGDGRSTPQRRRTTAPSTHPHLPSFSQYGSSAADADEEADGDIVVAKRSPVVPMNSRKRVATGDPGEEDDSEATEDEVVYRGDGGLSSRGPSRASVLGRSAGSNASVMRS